jgi:hypothetical protein
VWRVGDQRRVLSPRLSQREKTLILLYKETTPVSEAILAGWVEANRPASFRRDVLRPLHRSKQIEFDEKARTVLLSPIGVRHVETSLPLSITG